jgi:histidinol-phosphate aminotransferase
MTLPAASSFPSRGFSRRNFLRAAAASSALASLPFVTEAHLAHAAIPKFAPSDQGIHIDANENPMGPSEGARKAIAAMIPDGGRYLFDKEIVISEIFARQQGLDPEMVVAYAGSSEPLHLTVRAFASPTRPLVIADPSFEAPMWAAQTVNAPILKIPLADPHGAAAHDMKAMLAASPTPGVIYICNPNNPTGTITPHEEIEKAIDNLPEGSVALVDEAYIHFTDTPSCIPLVKQGKNVLVLRTFSKLYGMAGIRMGFIVGRPELLAKITPIGGQNPLPITAVAAAKASLLDPELVPTRKKIMAELREENIAFLRSHGYAVTPSVSNCFMLNVKKPGKEVQAALAAKEIYIGRVWPAWPDSVRVTVGTQTEMAAFQKAFVEVMKTDTAGLEPPVLHPRLRATPFSHLS